MLIARLPIDAQPPIGKVVLAIEWLRRPLLADHLNEALLLVPVCRHVWLGWQDLPTIRRAVADFVQAVPDGRPQAPKEVSLCISELLKGGFWVVYV